MTGGGEHWLSEIRGARVLAADGTVLGRVEDLALERGGDRARVAEVHYRKRRGALHRVPWSDVASLDRHAVHLRGDARTAAGPTAATAPQLARDVLDAQVVDVAGRRLRRVSDVRLREADGALRIAGVDTGWRTLLRRMGLWRGSAPAPAHELLDWADVHLATAAERVPPGDTLAGMAPAGLSELVARLPPDDGAAVLEAVGPAEAAEALSRARPRLGGRMISSLGAEPAGEILTAMAIDDAVAALRHVEAGRGAELLERVPGRRAAELRRLLALPPHTAGGLMTTDVRTAAQDEPLEAVRARLAADPPPLEGLATVFLEDAGGRYVAALTPTALLAGAPPRRLPALAVDTPLDDVIDVFALEDVLALPVVDGEGRIVGAVAIDDVLEELLVERLPHHRRRYRRARVRERGPA
jgi:CBS domain-containing protein